MNELMQGFLLGLGVAIAGIFFILRLVADVGMTNCGADAISRLLAWIFVMPFIGAGFYLIYLGLVVV